MIKIELDAYNNYKLLQRIFLCLWSHMYSVAYR